MMNFNKPRGMMGMMPSAQPQGGTPKQHNENRTYAGQYFSDVMEDGGGQYANYDFGDGSTMKVYIPDNYTDRVMGMSGPALADEDFKVMQMGDKFVLAPPQKSFDMGGVVPEGAPQGGQMPQGEQGGPVRATVAADAGEVMTDPQGREYLNMQLPDGNVVQVYADNYGWNEVEGAQMRDEQGMGKFMSIPEDLDLPIVQDPESGEYQLDAATYEQEMSAREEGRSPQKRPENVAPVGHLLKQMQQMGPQKHTLPSGKTTSYQGTPYGQFSPPVQRGMNMENGGKFPDLSGDGKVTKKDILMGRGVIPAKSKKYDNGGKQGNRTMRSLKVKKSPHSITDFSAPTKKIVMHSPPPKKSVAVKSNSSLAERLKKYVVKDKK